MNELEQGMDEATGYVAPRTCTLVDEGDPQQVRTRQAPLSDYAPTAAYVLIAEPGAGKTTAFNTEAAREGAICVTVRNFLRFDRPEWRDATLFLDGLDESRAGPVDRRMPLDRIVQKLECLGCRRFRLSCRWGDWLAANDKKGLAEVSPDGTVTVVRLDPLSKQNIKDILARNHGIEDADGFLAAARDRGLDRLLGNPQNLKLLAESVVALGNWPDSGLETFERACRMLVRETNGEHLAANPSATDTDPLIEAAGRLCAVQLLAGNAGYSLPDRAEPDDDYPSLAEVVGDAGGRARQVLGTRLFAGVSEGKLAPAHRQIAEFLAARHVSGLLHAGLSLGRVLALITGFDGELLPVFQNFASWLAVHNKQARSRLSQLHPSGLIYQGDRETFSVDEKRAIVHNLRREWTWNAGCLRSRGRVAGFGGIVSPDLEDTFREILSDGERGHAHQCYVLLLMQMLADGDPLPELSDVLEETVRDTTWYQNVRSVALEVLAGYSERSRFDSAALRTMVCEINGGVIDDPDDELLGILLKSLYPRVLPMAEVRTYLRAPKLKSMMGEYSKFWTDHVPRESRPEQLGELLDGIAANPEICKAFMLDEVGTSTRMARLPVEVLRRVLRDRQGRVATDQLYNWLGMFSDNGLKVVDQDIASLRFALAWDAKALKALIAHAVESCVANGEACAGVVDRRLFGARPFGYGHWCIEKALAAGESEGASFYLRELIDWVTDGRAGDLGVEDARAGLAVNEALLRQFDQMRGHPAEPKSRPSDRRSPESPDEVEERPRDHPDVAAASSAPKAPRVGPQLLHKAAKAYLGIDGRFAGRTPRERLTDLAGSSLEFRDAVLAEMECTIRREDLPDCDDVVRLFDERRVDLLALPLAAGLHSLEQSGRLSIGDLNKDQIRLAVTILYTLPQQFVDPASKDGTGVYRPEWFRALLREDPALVADVLCRTAARKLETGVQQVTELHELWHAEDHGEVAELVALPLLREFPQVDTDAALLALCWLLHAALAGHDWTELGRLVEERLEQGGHLPGERSCWLVAGYLVDPERWRDKLGSLTEDETNLEWLGTFLATGRVRRDDLFRRLRPRDVEPLVVASGAASRREGLPEQAYWAVCDLISTLGNNPGAAATEALEALGNAADAKPWLPAIADAGERQAGKRREQEYRHCDIGEVVRTLDNRSPANAGDLAALVFDELVELSRRIRHGSTSDWRQHWNVDANNRPDHPKPEDACRDALLSDLQERLAPLGVDAQPEGVYAEDNRADIRVSFGGFNVPVEIKRSCHRDVWTAVQDQLIAKYTRDPGAAGFGIYLVLWFGDIQACRPTKCGDWRPTTADDVKGRLEQSLSDRERGLISICVVDVSVPPPKSRRVSHAPKAIG